MADLMLTLSDCAAALQVSERTVRREIAAGRLATVRIRGLIRVRQSALSEYIDRLPSEQTCQSESSPPVDIRSELLSALAAESAARCRPALPEPTRGRSKMHSSAERSMLRLAGSRSD